MSKQSKVSNISFKQALEQVAAIVSRLESDDCELEEMAGLYESGVNLLHFCEKKINDTKMKIEQINSEDYLNKNGLEKDLYFNNSGDSISTE